ncbi:MAG: FHA domain-containing protein [Myxococcota bacterium]
MSETAGQAPAPPPKPAEPPPEPTRMIKLQDREKKVRQRKQKPAVLVVSRQGIPPATLKLDRPRTIIGRDKDQCDVVLDEDAVSRQHASVTREASGFYVLHDLGSRNGVAVAGQKVSRRTLIHGDTFIIGSTSITFQLANPEGKKG